MRPAAALALSIARAVRGAGGHALFVGGWVRDRLRGHIAENVDLEVYGVPADRLHILLADFGSVNAVGKNFSVYKVGSIDVALPRRESKSGRGHRGFMVTGDPDLPYDQAFRRRDFTINAIGWDPLTEEYVDPYSGRADLARGLLRAVDPDTFKDDSLRVLRAVQFAARFEFSLDPDTARLCADLPLDDLPAERIWAELDKLLRLANRPALGFTVARSLGVVERLFPEMVPLIDCPQEPEWHPEGDVWTHTLLVIDEARARIDDLARSKQIAVMLGAVCHDFGKPATTRISDGRIRSLNHEAAGVSPATAFLDRLNIHTIDGFDVRHQILGMVAHHLTPGMWHRSRDGVGDGAFRRLARKVDLELLARLSAADCLGRTGKFDCSAMEWFIERARALGVEHAPPDPLLKGRHLIARGWSPGPALGEILRAIYEQQLDGRITTVEGAIDLAEAQHRAQHPDG
ncbi:MAG: polynucleotide adenylyltransferase [Acidobacteria bacterium]|nr:polynucleotide adenylyltransferase [Acidobacteriota bacterium]|tara:strand:- start:1114 stop:2493 length:1380 start_codon:yes stop_codon:yes gene_type:complete